MACVEIYFLINFDEQCNRCHLGASPRVRTANLPVLGAGDGQDGSTLDLGVETLGMIRARQGPGEQWALSTNPSEFRERGGRVMRTRVHHRDPRQQAP